IHLFTPLLCKVNKHTILLFSNRFNTLYFENFNKYAPPFIFSSIFRLMS
ncbi:hypothetical protein LINPERHAP1_LOCUS30348, partial [Linum perenne]